MACNFSRCNCCNRFIKSTKVEISETSTSQFLKITIPEISLENLRNYYLVICQKLPLGSNVLPVIISNGTQLIPLECKKGNYVHADQLKTRVRYNVTYGNDPIHIIIDNYIGKTGYTV